MEGSCKRGMGWIALFLGLTALLGGVVCLLGGMPLGRSAPVPQEVDVDGEQPQPGETKPPITCVVIDAGHGGEDGGTSSAAGTIEKDVNLEVAVALRDLLEAAGIPTVMTRTEDKLLYDRGVDYHGRKKVLDLAARRTIAEATEGCLFVSIHMNAFPQTQYSGMQVWYGMADARSFDVATAIQKGSTTLMPDNQRKVKAAGSSIYLLERLACPAVLVECGFLSNPEEAARLSDAAYRRAVATVIFGGILAYVEP